MDSLGVNTYRTARNLSRFMRSRGLKSAMVITQYFHIYRSKLALEKSGVQPVYSAHANFFEWRDAYSTLREAIGVYAYQFRDYDSPR